MNTESRTKARVLDTMIRIVEFIFVITIIFDCNSVYRAMRFGLNPRLLAIIAGIGSASLLIFLHVLKDRKNTECIKSHKLLFLVSFVFVFAFYAVNASKSEQVGYIEYFLLFTNVMVILFKIYRRNNNVFRLFYLLEHTMLVIAAFSLILWIGSNVLGLWGMSEDVFVDWGGKYYDTNYLNLCIRRWVGGYQPDAVKNLGVFCEPPMFGLMLGVGLYTELFLKKRTNIISVIIFLAALASSRAILAIMVSMLALFFKFLEIIEGKKHAVLLGMSVAIVAVACGTGLFIFKLQNESLSLMTHLDDFAASLKCWTHYPLFGCGYNTEDPIVKYMSDFRMDNTGLSNSGAVVLAEGGIMLWSFYVIPFVLMAVAFFKKNKKLAYWSVGMFAFWVVVIFHTRLLIFMLVALGYSMIELELSESENKKKKVSFAIKWFDENLPDTPGIWEKNPMTVPMSFRIVMMGILGGVAVYSLFNIQTYGAVTAACAIVILVCEAAMIFIKNKKKSVKTGYYLVSDIVLWALFMAFGQLYTVLDGLYEAFGLYMQDNWWTSIVAVIILYAVGALTDILTTKKNSVEAVN